MEGNSGRSKCIQRSRISELTRILKRFTPLASAWGYDHIGHNHQKIEDRIHKDSSFYACIYPTTDIVFRNLARIAANKPLILSDSSDDSIVVTRESTAAVHLQLL